VKRTALRRGTARLERRTPLRSAYGLRSTTGFSRYKPIRRKPLRRLGRDEGERGYTAWLHYQVCRAVGVVDHPCSDRTQAAHLRDHTGVGRKEPADRQTSLCDVIHGEYDERRGHFEGWTNEARVEWFNARIAESRAEWFLLTAEERAAWDEAADRWARRVA